MLTELARALTLKFCSERYKAPENRRKKMRAELNARTRRVWDTGSWQEEG